MKISVTLVRELSKHRRGESSAEEFPGCSQGPLTNSSPLVQSSGSGGILGTAGLGLGIVNVFTASWDNGMKRGVVVCRGDERGWEHPG